ncbi:MAG TPA: purine-binding chemotaxis protein CheW [Campylobacteraceae bacterium]|jgi:purine-binding chemotaxis protein CheW|nr:purine-binding chemotaxis protein CheW [Campylobacteraceae bacterium]
MEYVVFRLNSENYTIPLEKIKEILVYSQVIITELFNEAPWIKGMINLRGEVIPIVDLRIRFDIKDATFKENTVIIVVKTDENKLVGVIVDNIESILELDSQIVVAAPDMGVSVDPRFLEGLIRLNKEEMATLLNIDAVLKIEETA